MKGHTATEKILAQRGNVKEVFPGDVVVCDVDCLFSHTPWNMINYWRQIGGVKRIFDSDKFVLALGHHVCLPADAEYASHLELSRKDARSFGIKHIYDMGTGNGHIIMLEEGFVRPGHVYVGADSHSTIYGAVGAFGTALSYEVAEIALSGKAWFKVPATVRVNLEGATPKGVCARDVGQYLLKEVGADGALWKTLEFAGTYVHTLSVYQRMIFSLLAVEMGAVTGFIEPDEIVHDFLRNRVRNPYQVVLNDPDCQFEREWQVDVSKLEPMIGRPPRPAETYPVTEVAKENVKVHQAYIGGCTGSSLEDFQMAREILQGHKVHPDTRLVIVPGTQEIMSAMLKDGLIDFFLSLGAIISPPYCGPCQLMCYGHLGEGEVMMGTHPRNQPGRAGKNGGIYLGSPYSVAAAAICGKITDPRIFL